MEDAIAAVECGATAIGFIFHSKSPRYISPEKAREIVIKIAGKVAFVGVFVDEPLDYVHTISNVVGLDFIQLHGNESSKYCDLIKLPVLKDYELACFLLLYNQIISFVKENVIIKKANILII